ncbi:MAG: LON peptidase substrate-binding domain-containing protein [Allosphingosinicella sp.]
MTGTVGSLPEILPIFPLPGALLLPRGHLPLHIFEPRYRKMTEAALSGERMIGMVQPRDPDAETIGDDGLIYDTGCAGRIISFTEIDDGRFLLTLRGVCRFRIARELPLQDGFRRVRPDYEPYQQDVAEPAGLALDRENLIGSVHRYVHAKGLTADWPAIKEASDEALVVALSMMCPFEPREKQALLECRDLPALAHLLTSLLEMGVRDADGAGSGVAH